MDDAAGAQAGATVILLTMEGMTLVQPHKILSDPSFIRSSDNSLIITAEPKGPRPITPIRPPAAETPFVSFYTTESIC
jgi:hypothetical protein